MMYQSKLVLATLLLSSCSSVAAFNPRLGGNPTFRALQIRGGDEPDVTEMKAAEKLNVVTEDAVGETIPVVEEGVEPVAEAEPVVVVEEPPSSLPTYQRMMNTVRQPTSEDPIVDSLLVETSEVEATAEDAIDALPDATTSSGVGMIPTALAFVTNIKTSLISLDAAFPVLKYVVAVVIVAAILINIVTGMLSSGGVDEPVPEPRSITAEPVETGSVEKKDQNIAQTALALAVGAAGLIAGSLAMVADGADDEATTSLFRPRSTATAVSSEEEEEEDSSEGGLKNISNCDKAKIGAGSAALVGGISSRAVILGKVLSIWF
mmetsp:Transcript_29887/g.45735  ORF Transcript_29887/g.45735 Transcript_29887/m.45735 type:complete len:320 (-) Transcript_29887:1620-2579(-)